MPVEPLNHDGLLSFLLRSEGLFLWIPSGNVNLYLNHSSEQSKIQGPVSDTWFLVFRNIKVLLHKTMDDNMKNYCLFKINCVKFVFIP